MNVCLHWLGAAGSRQWKRSSWRSGNWEAMGGKGDRYGRTGTTEAGPGRGSFALLAAGASLAPTGIMDAKGAIVRSAAARPGVAARGSRRGGRAGRIGGGGLPVPQGAYRRRPMARCAAGSLLGYSVAPIIG